MRVLNRMIKIEDLEQAISSFTEGDEGFFVTRSEIGVGNKIVVEVDHDTKPLDIDTIVALTRHIENSLGEELGDYELEVSSAGLTSPLVGTRRYRKFLDKELEVLLRSGVKEVGVLKEVTEDGFTLEVIRMEKPEGERRKRPIPHTLNIPYEEVKRATYLLKV